MTRNTPLVQRLLALTFRTLHGPLALAGTANGVRKESAPARILARFIGPCGRDAHAP